MRQLKFLALAFGLALVPTCVHAQSQGSGILYASDFGAWSLPQGNTPTSGMIQWPSAAICQVSSNGYSFVAVKVGRPLTIVDVNPAQTETVTPVAVTTSGGSCTVTAPMAYTHLSYSVRSGTAGLQEAIDYSAHLIGGSVVVLTPGWTVLGGTTGMVTSATGQAATSILDLRTANLCQFAYVGPNYAANGCGTNGVSLTQTGLQTMAGPLASPGFQGPLTGSVTGGVINVGSVADYGDSLTAGNEGVVQMDTYPSLLQTNAGINSINYGVGGTTSTQIAVRAGATASSVQVSSNGGVIPACTTLTCTPLTVGFPLGYEPTANSTTGGGGVVNVTGTIHTTPAIHGTVSLSLYQGTSTWSISAGTVTINGLVLVAGASVAPAAGVAIEANGLNGGIGCSDLNGPHLLTGGSSTTASFPTSCTGSGTGGVVSIYTFTPDSYTAGATISGTPAWNTDTPCISCSVIAWPGRNNLFTNGSYPSGLAVVQGSVNALAAIVPAGKQFVVLPVIPENISSEWSSGGNYSTLTAYRTWLQATYPNNIVDVWTALQAAGKAALPTDAQDVANGNIPTSLRAVTATGTLHASILSTDTTMQIDVSAGILAANQVVTLDVGVSTAAENVNCTTVTGSSNPYTLSGCTRGFGGGTPFAHSGGATINQDDATHLNQAGYAIVASAIAAHLGVSAGTSPATTAQLNRSVTLGAPDVQNHYVAGNAQGGLQLNFGTTGSIKDAIGTVNANSVIGSQFSAYNAAQSGGYGIDQWSQSLGTNKSYLSLLSSNGWGVFSAPIASSAAPFTTFWGATPLVQVSNASLTSNIQSIFGFNLNNFSNPHDTANTVSVQSGLTADQNEVFQFLDKSNACLWQEIKEGTFNSLRHFDCKNSLYRFIETPNGATVINSGAGANPVQFNGTTGSGTGGVLFYSGGASPANVGSIDGSGNLTLAGGIQAPLIAGAGTYCLQIGTSGIVANAGAPCATPGVTTINSTAGAFTFTGAGVSCVSTTCTFSGGGGGGVTPVNVTIGSTTVSAASCQGSATTFTFSGATTSMGAWWSQTGDISGLTGYGFSNGIVIDVWVSATNQGSYKLCNVTATPITTSSITVRMNAN